MPRKSKRENWFQDYVLCKDMCKWMTFEEY